MEKQSTSDFDINFKKNSFLFFLFIVSINCKKTYPAYPSSNTAINGQLDWQKKLYFDRIAEFQENPIGYDKIVFLGNSIIQGGGDWNKKFKTNNIVNRGISGDYTEGILARLDEIIFYKPTSVFIMIGINEFFTDNSNNVQITPKYVANNIFKIAEKITSESKKTTIFIFTILPINNDQYINVKNVNYNFLAKDFTPSVNDQVQKTNLILKANKKYKVIDLHSIFVGSTLEMNTDLSSDGVHLNENGYNLWVKNNFDLIKQLEKITLFNSK